MTITLTFNTAMTERAFARVRSQAPLAIARALNRSAASGKTLMVREISKDIGVKQAEVRETIGVSEARPDRQEASIISTGKRIPLIDFQAKGPYPSRGRGRGVTYKIGQSRRTIPNAFIGIMRSGHRGVFIRTSRARLPITELHGPSLPHVFRKYIPVALARLREQMQKNLQSEFRYYTQIKKAA